MDGVGTRDAAAQAAECRGGAEMLDVLQQHADPVPWIQAYILDMCKDLPNPRWQGQDAFRD